MLVYNTVVVIDLPFNVCVLAEYLAVGEEDVEHPVTDLHCGTEHDGYVL